MGGRRRRWDTRAVGSWRACSEASSFSSPAFCAAATASSRATLRSPLIFNSPATASSTSALSAPPFLSDATFAPCSAAAFSRSSRAMLCAIVSASATIGHVLRSVGRAGAASTARKRRKHVKAPLQKSLVAPERTELKCRPWAPGLAHTRDKVIQKDAVRARAKIRIELNRPHHPACQRESGGEGMSAAATISAPSTTWNGCALGSRPARRA